MVSSIWEKYLEVDLILKFSKILKTMAILTKRSVGRKIKTSPAAPANYSLGTHYRGLYALRVTPRYQTQQGKWSLTTPGYAGSAGMTI